MAILHENVGLLTALVAGMIAIPVVTGVLGVWQTCLSNRVGQAVMHDLRTAVYRHLQRLSLAFFTRTRTGEVQSGSPTTSAGSRTSYLDGHLGRLQRHDRAGHRRRDVAPRLAPAVFALALLPLFVWLTKRVGDRRREVTAELQASLADVSSIVQESLSVSGILLGKTMGRSGRSGRALRCRVPAGWPTSRCGAHDGPLDDGRDPDDLHGHAPRSSTGSPGWTIANGSETITIGTLVAFTTLQARLFFPIGSLLGVQIEVQSSLALFDRIFEYLDQPVDIEEGTRSLARPRGDVAFERVRFRYGGETWTLDDVSFTVPAGTTTALVGETGSGKTTCAYLSARLYDATEGR